MQTWSVKIDEDLKEKIQDIAKTDFDNNQDFMNTLIQLYEMNQIKESGSVLSGEVEEIQKLTNRIINLFVYANGKVCTTLENKDKFLQEELSSKEDTIKMLHEKLKEIELDRNNIGSINDTLAESNKEYAEEVIDLNKSKSTLESLVNEYKEKNDMLTGMLQEYKEDREDNKLLKAENEKLNLNISKMEIKLDAKDKEIARLAESMSSTISNHEAEIAKIEESHNSDIDILKNSHEIEIRQLKKDLDVEHNLSILKAQQEYQNKIASITDKHSVDIDNLQHKYTSQIEKYQDKYNELLRQMEEQRDKFQKKQDEYEQKVKEIAEEELSR